MPKGKFGKQYPYKGRYVFLTELERISGINFQTIKNRIEKQHMTPEEAISIPLRQAATYLYHGRYYTVAQLAVIAGMKTATIRYRMNVLEMTAEQAVDTPISRGGRKTKLPDGCKYPKCEKCIFKDCVW